MHVIAKYFILVMWLGLTTNILCAQTANLKDFRLEDDNGIRKVILELELPENYEMDDERFLSDPNINSSPEVHIYSENNESLILAKTSLGLYRKGIVVSLPNSNSPTILTQDLNNKIYISFREDLILPIYNTSTRNSELIKINKESIESVSLSKGITLKNLFDNSNYISAQIPTNNNIDVGVATENDGGASSDYALSFNYITKYSNNNRSPFYFEGTGLISTNSKDSLNHLNLYPISFSYNNLKYASINSIKWQAGAQIGSESNQTFSSGRIVGNVYGQTIIPNLINLSYGANRFRLKPVLKLGVKAYQEYANDREVVIDSENTSDDNLFSVQPFGELYYYIPVLHSYSFIIDLNSFYETNSNINIEKEIKFNYNLTFGLDIPKTDFKVMFKYQNGTNQVTFKDGQQILVGLLLDLWRGGKLQ